MKELDLYKFCQDKEMHWHKDELLIFINFYDLKEFVEVIGKSCFDDDGIQVTMKDHYIGLDLAPICESWDVDPERIYSKDND